MTDRHTIANGYLTATIRSEGAELCSLLDGAGQEMLWQAGPEWPRHAPILFPIVGELRDDRYELGGHAYRLTRHGFARARRFAWGARTATACRLILHDDSQTKAVYPFGFRFAIDYTLTDDALEVTFTITNTGNVVLPASAGAHPAFRWPLADGIDKTDHFLEFEQPEPAPIRRLENGLLRPDPVPSPIVGNRLALDPALFHDDAIILDRLASQSVRYGAPGAPTIEVSWEGFRDLGVWSKPEGADFLCIEPWYGTASPADFAGDFLTKPGLMLIPPGDRRVLLHRVRFC